MKVNHNIVVFKSSICALALVIACGWISSCTKKEQKLGSTPSNPGSAVSIYDPKTSEHPDSQTGLQRTTASATAPDTTVPGTTAPADGTLGAQTAAPTAPAAPVTPPPPNCFLVTYHHKDLPQHNSDEACSRHKNTILLKHSKFNKESLCVRVNNTPVRFQINKKKPAEIFLAAIAGPKSTITATYCIQKNTCNQNCKIPKDEFLDAIGGSEEAAAGKNGQWDASDTGAQELNNKVERELAEFNETHTADGGTLFKDWLSDEAVPACSTNKQATSPGVTKDDQG